MTVTLGVAWALFILAPGLAVFAALYTSGGGKVVAPAPPAPNSFTALSIVIFGALTAHAAAAFVFVLADGVAHVLPALRPPWNPNPYAYFLAAQPKSDPFLGLEVWSLLFVLLVLSIGAYLVMRWAIGRAEGTSIDRARLEPPQPAVPLFRFLYGGWASTLVQLSPEAAYDKHLAAYVVTDMETENGWVGYEGEVASLSLDTDKQIVALTLKNCQAFRLEPTKTSLSHRVMARVAPIPLLLIERSQIKNVALQVVFQRKPSPRPADGMVV